MSELRKDPACRRWVIIAVERAKRPNDFQSDNSFLPDINLDQYCSKRLAKKIFPYFHRFFKNQNNLFLDSKRRFNFNGLFSEYKKEILKIRASKEKIKYLAIFKNHKIKTKFKEIGGPYSNLIGLFDYPENIKKELKGSLDYYKAKKSCVYCDVVSEELRKKERIIQENKSFLAFAPFASRFPFESWILPKKHACSYSSINSIQLKDLSLIFKDVLFRLQRLLGDFSYTYTLHVPLFDDKEGRQNSLSYHWRFEIIPLLTRVAGFEWGTGIYINPTAPELAAQYLRENKASSSSPGKKSKSHSSECPFCFGNELMTPPETDADRPQKTKPNSPGWLTRTVPNKFPALRKDLNEEKLNKNIFKKIAGVGAHEVIIENPNHKKHLPDLSLLEIERVIKVYRRRFTFLSADKRFRYILIFKNYGLAAGASLEHPHTQLICLPIVPERVQEEIDFSQKYFLKNKICIFCDELKKVKSQKEKIVAQNKDFLAFCPVSSRLPFELTIIPVEHESKFNLIDNNQIKNLALILKDILNRFKNRLNDCPYNLLIHTSPVNTEKNIEDFYHWHIELLPKLGEVSGFEWSTGSYINPVLPKSASQNLKQTF